MIVVVMAANIIALSSVAFPLRSETVDVILIFRSGSVLCLWGWISLFHLICICVVYAVCMWGWGGCHNVPMCASVEARGGFRRPALLFLLILWEHALSEPQCLLAVWFSG